MSFFKDFKNDLSMAVNNIAPEEDNALVSDESTDITAEAMPDNGGDSILLDDFKDEVSDPVFDAPLDEVKEVSIGLDLEPMVNTEEDTIVAAQTEVGIDAAVLDALEADNTEQETAVEVIEEPAMEAKSEEVIEEIPDTKPVEVEENIINTLEEDKKMSEIDEKFANEPATDENAVITEGMKVTGDIISTGNMDVLGAVKGNIDIKGKLTITGNIEGNSKAAEIFADSAKITGDIVSVGSVKVGQSSVIVGDIAATSAVIAGAVKGNIDVHGPVILDTSAIVMGDIKSKSVQINNGAVIEGHCSQCYAEVSPTSFFNDVK